MTRISVPKSVSPEGATLTEAALGQIWVANAAAMLIFTAVYERTTRKYSQRGERYVQSAGLRIDADECHTTLRAAGERHWRPPRACAT
jgi:hypothetical protein